MSRRGSGSVGTGMPGLTRAWTGGQVQGARGAGTVGHPAGVVVRDVLEGRARDGGRGRKSGGCGGWSEVAVGVAVGGWSADRGCQVERSVVLAGRRLDAERSSLVSKRSGLGQDQYGTGPVSGPGSSSSLSARSAKVQRCRSPRRHGSHDGLSFGGRQVASQWRGSLSKRQRCGPLRAQVGVSGSGQATAARAARRAEVGQERKSSRGRGRAGRRGLRRRGPESAVQVLGGAVVDGRDGHGARWCRPVPWRWRTTGAVQACPRRGGSMVGGSGPGGVGSGRAMAVRIRSSRGSGRGSVRSRRVGVTYARPYAGTYLRACTYIAQVM